MGIVENGKRTVKKVEGLTFMQMDKDTKGIG